MSDNATKNTNYVSNDSSLGGDQFYDALETMEKRMSFFSYASARSTCSMAPSPAAAELMAALASSGSSRKIDIGNAVQEFGSTTAGEGPPGGSLGISSSRKTKAASRASMGKGNPFDQTGDAATANRSAPSAIRRWPPSRNQQPSRMVVMDISSSETTPTTTPGGGRTKVDRSGTWSGSQSPSTPTPPLPPARPAGNMNPFATTPTRGNSPTNPFAPENMTRNPFVNFAEEHAAGSPTVVRSSAPSPSPVPAQPDRARPPPLPPRRGSATSGNAQTPREGAETYAGTPPAPSGAPSDALSGTVVPDAARGANAECVDAAPEAAAKGPGSEGGEADSGKFLVVNKVSDSRCLGAGSARLGPRLGHASPEAPGPPAVPATGPWVAIGGIDSVLPLPATIQWLEGAHETAQRV